MQREKNQTQSTISQQTSFQHSKGSDIIFVGDTFSFLSGALDFHLW